MPWNPLGPWIFHSHLESSDPRDTLHHVTQPQLRLPLNGWVCPQELWFSWRSRLVFTPELAQISWFILIKGPITLIHISNMNCMIMYKPRTSWEKKQHIWTNYNISAT